MKTTIRYHLTPIRIAIIKKTRNNKHWQGCGEKGTLVHCWWECNWRFLKKLKMGNSLAVQWLGLCSFTVEATGSIPGRGTKIPQAVQRGQKKKKIKNRTTGTSLVVQLLRLCTSTAGGLGSIPVQSLVRELRSHMPHGAAKKKKQKNYHIIQQFHFWVFIQRKQKH